MRRTNKLLRWICSFVIEIDNILRKRPLKKSISWSCFYRYGDAGNLEDTNYTIVYSPITVVIMKRGKSNA